jgi:hypothetical protein
MPTKPVPICGEHKTAKEWRPTTFEYREEDISIRVPNLRLTAALHTDRVPHRVSGFVSPLRKTS